MKCPKGQQILNNQQPDLEFVTIYVPGVINIHSNDILVKFNRPHKFFMIGACAPTLEASNCYMHFVPLNIPQANPIAPVGTENWIPITDSNAQTNTLSGKIIKFKIPIQQFFITVDHAGGNYATPLPFTIIGTDSIETIRTMQTI